MLPSKSPKQKLKIIIPLTRRPMESPETSPLESPEKLEATESKDSTERISTKKDSSERDGTTERNSAKEDNTERTFTESLSRLGLSYVDKADTESLARLGVSYVNRDSTETIRESTRIKHWNCHVCCKINEIEAENPRSWTDVGSEHCTNLDCKHKRCYKCYYLDYEWQPLQYCDGRLVDPERYEKWYNNFERV